MRRHEVCSGFPVSCSNVPLLFRVVAQNDCAHKADGDTPSQDTSGSEQLSGVIAELVHFIDWDRAGGVKEVERVRRGHRDPVTCSLKFFGACVRTVV